MHQVHVSKMSGKLTGIPGINTNTLSNPFCQKANASSDTSNICTRCYSHAMLRTYRAGCVDAFERNSKLLSGQVLLPWQIPVIPSRHVRVSAHGELINATHLENVYRIAESNKHATFALWTKRKDLVRKHRARPENVILVYSNPHTNRVVGVPKGFDKVFNNVDEPDARENCTGQKCITCLACYQHGGTDVIVERVKLNGRAV